jgi:hypothetical protein
LSAREIGWCLTSQCASSSTNAAVSPPANQARQPLGAALEAIVEERGNHHARPARTSGGACCDCVALVH